MTFNPAEKRDASGKWSGTAAKLAALMKSDGGFTHIVGTGETNPAKGFSVGITGSDGKDGMTLPYGSTTAEDIKRFAALHRDELSKPGRAIGGWSNDDESLGGKRDALDVVEVHQDRAAAMESARLHGQDAIFDLGSFDTIPTEKAPVSKKKSADLAIQTPLLRGGDFRLAKKGGPLAYWKQVLPLREIHYTAKDGSRQTLNFDEQYLTDLATNQAVDSVPFVLADADNRHTMNPELFRGEVVKMAIRKDLPDPKLNGLYAKIVFPDEAAAASVLNNPKLGVSARIRENIEKDDGTTINRGIIHVLGTLDPQATGMGPWEPTDLSTEQGDVLDLSAEEYVDMAKAKSRDLKTLTNEDIEAMSDEELDTLLAPFLKDLEEHNGDDAEDGADTEDEDNEDEGAEDRETVGAGASLSTKATQDIELANQRADSANRRAAEALKRVAAAEWQSYSSKMLGEGVPPFALDLAKPILERADDMVIDLSNADEDDLNVSTVVRGLLDGMKGMIDLSKEEGHATSWKAGDDDPDAELLDVWDKQAN